MNRTLVNGCSFSRGPNSWPYHLKKINQTGLINLAQAGAGNSYIHESTVCELAQRQYDLVLVMWSGISRLDFNVSDIDNFSNSKYTSLYQHTRNDWEEKITSPVNDQDYVMKNWVFGCGQVNKEKEIIDSGLFEGIYKNLGYNDFVFHFLIKVISLQNTLRVLNIPYIFSFYDTYEKDLQIFPELCKLINWKNVFTEYNIYDIAQQNDWYDIDGVHPGYEAHRLYAEHLDKFIEKL